MRSRQFFLTANIATVTKLSYLCPVARILAIDYGTKRTGVAATDPLQISVNGLDTQATDDVMPFLKQYCSEEEVEKIVVGEPRYPDGTPSKIHHIVVGFVRSLQKEFPAIEVVMHDERFSSKAAERLILQAVPRQKKRRNKALVDKMSAILILQDYLNHYHY